MNIPKYSKLFIQMSGKRPSGKRLIRETSVRESDCPGNVRYILYYTLTFFKDSLVHAVFLELQILPISD